MDKEQKQQLVIGLLRSSQHDDVIYDAALLRLLTVSEATAQLLIVDPEVQARYPEMPWTRIKGIGNVIRHAYDGIDADVIWATITGLALDSLMKLADIELGGDGSL